VFLHLDGGRRLWGRRGRKSERRGGTLLFFFFVYLDSLEWQFIWFLIILL
jgi:hypothetical protein